VPPEQVDVLDEESIRGTVPVYQELAGGELAQRVEVAGVERSGMVSA
jgi:hypothetical protein